MDRLGHVLIAGMGRSGLAAARYCSALLGSVVDSVTVIDSDESDSARERASALEELGTHVTLGSSEIDGHFDLAVVSPGIRPDSQMMSNVRSSADEVVSEIEFAFRRSSVPWVAVTGTNGKTTTTALITHLLRSAGVDAKAVGNIGVPAIEAVAEDPEPRVMVAEVSSFQLALIDSMRPRVAVLLNITPDHLDWHGSLQAYTADKARVFRNMGPGDVAVIDVDDAGSRGFADAVEQQGVHVARVSRRERTPEGASEVDGRLVLDVRSVLVDLTGIDEMQIRGPHNVSNALAAAAAAHAMGVSCDAISRGLRSFAPIEHRLEPVGTACGAEWFNDSKATNPDATLKAIDSFSGRGLILLVGGRNKGNDFTELAKAASAAARVVITFGEAGKQIDDAFARLGLESIRASTLDDAVRAAADLAHPGDAVVLSPACASFDEFSDYEARGRAFKDAVAVLECREES